MALPDRDSTFQNTMQRPLLTSKQPDEQRASRLAKQSQDAQSAQFGPGDGNHADAGKELENTQDRSHMNFYQDYPQSFFDDHKIVDSSVTQPDKNPS